MLLLCLQENLTDIGLDYINIWQNEYKKIPNNKFYLDIRTIEILTYLLRESNNITNNKTFNLNQYLKRNNLLNDSMSELLSLLKKVANKPKNNLADDYQNYYEPLSVFAQKLKKNKANAIDALTLEKWLLHYQSIKSK